jgi:hypothetical protein
VSTNTPDSAVIRYGGVVVPCGCCHGSGQVMHRRLTEVWRCLAHDQWLTTQQVATFIGIGGENAANLLRRLHRAGLAEREGSKPYRWKRREAAK